ncbi:protein UPSTREAM OF FLC [Cynara cardunculus var. scolymus]|uniref:protein UPSTREAM OF FLC n=1 Tax=Cynara cardunculus var. scolymus TaxID=59895 RepID=UPI000D62D71A|nr:protein UPSTREAM OF FLC [Cynara cardunculus var. scolymus]XP_024985954.1 protein UPSTREAM OF FLC [Cynara cardunculus var. scolymus]
MEGRVRKYGQQHQQLSPDRAKVWKERSPRYQQRQPDPEQEQEPEPELQQKSRKVPVVYYLCRNRQLEHPHFIEVPLTSSDGLFLRDVIEKLNILRGRGMASMYSWSCKRSYKNGFVWHDLCEDDLILPAHGNEYVLKGSELVEESNSGRFTPVKLQNLKQLPEPPSARSQDDSSSSTSMSGRETKHSQDEELSPPVRLSSSSGVSPESRGGKSTVSGGCLSLTEYKIYKSDGLADASTQTEENIRANKARETCTRGVSTDDGGLESLSNQSPQSQALCVKDNSEIQVDPSPPSSSSACSSVGKTETLESLIKADASKLNSFRRLEEGRMPANAKLRATDMLMQLISCGSISVKDHSFGLIPSYKPRFSDSKFPSPLFSTSVMLGELDCLPENPRFMSMRLEEKEYFSGSLVETKMLKEEGVATLKRSSSYNADRTNNSDPISDKEEATATRTKCIPRSLKASLGKQPKSESMRSPISEGPRISSEGGTSSRIVSPCPSNGSSKRMTEPCSAKKQSGRLESFREEGSVIKIEERLASGARVIIHSEAPCDTKGNL